MVQAVNLVLDPFKMADTGGSPRSGRDFGCPLLSHVHLTSQRDAYAADVSFLATFPAPTQTRSRQL